MSPGFASLLWFAAILAAIPVLLWLLKRSPMLGAHGQPPGTPRPVSVMPLGGQHKLVTVEVGRGDERLWLVLGVTPQGIRTLHTMVPQGDSAAPAMQPPAATFQQLLSRLKGKGGKEDQGGPGGLGGTGNGHAD
jgi:flagellar protein FliO/FliZ